MHAFYATEDYHKRDEFAARQAHIANGRVAFRYQHLWRWPHILKEAQMRIPISAILMIATVLTAVPARAQTYDPAYPVCLQIYQGWNDYYFECAYTSLPQCNASASGRAAQCIVNPYYAGRKTAPPGRRDRRHRRIY